ncbi:MAG: glycoside hydrolase family 36 protein [Anaerolineaceae bacterium]
MTYLQNAVFRLEFDPEHGVFSILTKDEKLPNILNAHLGVCYSQNGKLYRELNSKWEGCQEPVISSQNSEHGQIEMATFQLPANFNGLSYELTFGIVQEYPLIVWKVKVLNQSGSPINIEKVTLLKVDPAKAGEQVVFPQAKKPSEMGFFYNGWQSWSPVGWVAGDGRMPRTILSGLQAPMIYNPGTPAPGGRGVFSSDFFAALGDRTARTGFALGFLSQKQQFGSIQAKFSKSIQLEMWANCDAVQVNDQCSLETDWAVFNPILLDHRDPLNKYLEAVERENHVVVPAESPVGWCSWYHFYTHVTAKDVEANLDSIVSGQERLPIQLVQIDDGFESQIGDWFTFKSTFSDGVKPLAKKISQEGLIPGLWLAPFIIHPKSETFRQHPDWILRKANGRPVNAGYVWGVLDTALDLTVPEALQYACDVIRTAAKDWGYPYLKLDFLYAAALPGKYHDPTKTRAQVLRMGMEALREAMGADVTLLGCGAPFGSMLGLVEAMRIGPDVSGDWQPTFNGIKAFIKNEPSFPCARNSIHSILSRANLHGHWWVNDPDCLLIREDTHLTLEEVKTLATVIGMTGGSLLLSDDLPKLPKERMRLAEVLLPVVGERAQVLDWFDAQMPALLRLDLLNDTGEWHLVTRFNWQDAPADIELSPEVFGLPSGEYWVKDFWNEDVVHLSAGEKYTVKTVAAHGCVLCAFRRVQDGAEYLGSNLHYSMGREVAEWKATDSEVAFTLRLPRTTEGFVNLALPWEKAVVFCDDNPVEITYLAAGVIQIPVNVPGFTRVRVQKA